MVELEVGQQTLRVGIFEVISLMVEATDGFINRDFLLLRRMLDLNLLRLIH
jgi:hypothetical protein